VPKIRLGPDDAPPVVTRSAMRAHGSVEPARVQPTVSRIAVFAQCNASGGSAS
jgi:hypothetical protein